MENHNTIFSTKINSYNNNNIFKFETNISDFSTVKIISKRVANNLINTTIVIPRLNTNSDCQKIEEKDSLLVNQYEHSKKINISEKSIIIEITCETHNTTAVDYMFKLFRDKNNVHQTVFFDLYQRD